MLSAAFSDSVGVIQMKNTILEDEVAFLSCYFYQALPWGMAKGESKSPADDNWLCLPAKEDDRHGHRRRRRVTGPSAAQLGSS